MARSLDPVIVKVSLRPAPQNLRFDPPATLSEIKQSKKFEDWALVRQSRLSTMAVPEKFVEWMRKRYPAVRF